MKTHTIKTLKAELLVVELPIGWDYEPITDDKTFIYHKTEEGTNDHHIEGYTLLGKPDEVSEEDATELVESKFIDFWYPNEFDGYGFDKFKNYKTGEFSEVDATESLLSLVETEIYWDVNPEGKFPRYAFDENINPKDIKARVYHQKWQEAEQKTFNRNRTLIFKKVTPKI